MAKRIEGSDIIEDGHLNNAISQAEKLLGVYKEIDATLKKTAQDAKKVGQSASTNRAADIQKLDSALKQSNETKRASIQLDNQIAKAEAKLAAFDQKRAVALNKARLELQRQNKAAKEQAILTSRTSTEYEKASVRLNQMRRRLKDLILTEGEGSKKTKQLAAQVSQLDSRLKRADARAGQFQRSVGNYGKALGRVGGILKGFGATLIATFGIRSIGRFFKASIDGFRTQEKAVKKVEQAIQSTGGAAGKTSEELQKLASSLQENSLFGDEEILNNVSAQLLTFTNIAGENFNRTQQVALDLATVLDGDLKSASIQLGKALNDPIANLSALSRSGIQFSAEQKNLIKSLAETGRLAEAQAVILDELERQYGGQAKAAAEADGGIQQLKNTFGDLQEIIGGELVKAIKPIADDLREFITNLDPEDVKAFANAIAGLIRAFANSAKRIFESIVAISKLTQSFDNSFESADNFKDTLENIVKAADLLIPGFSFFRDQVENLSEALGLASDNTEKLTETQKRNNTVRSKSIEIGNELLKQNEDELGDIPILIDALQDENTTREDKQAIIEKLNEDYPEVIGNIDLETASTEQLIQVKKDLIKALFDQAIAQKKAEVQAEITGQILELELKKIGKNANGVAFLNTQIEELTQGLLLVDDVEAKLRENLGDTIDALNLESPIGKTSDKINELRETIKGLEDALKSASGQNAIDLQERLDDARAELARYTGEYKALIDDGLDRERDANDESVKDLKGTNKEKEDEQRKAWEKRKDIEKTGFGELKKIAKDFNTDIREDDSLGFSAFITGSQEIIDKEREEFQKRQEQLKRFRDESIKIFKEITQALQENINRRIEARQGEIEDANNNIGRLQELANQGNADAAEAIKAERVRIAQEKLEIEQLEKKKRNLLIITTALEKASQNIGSGDGNPFKNASESIKSFLAGLPTFSEGTVGTVAQALGRTGTQDGHVVRVDDREHILSIKDSERLHKAGLHTNEAIVSAAMNAQNKAISSKVMSVTGQDMSINELRAIKQAIENFKPYEVTQQHFDFKQGLEVLKKNGKTIRNNYGNKKRI